MIRDKQIKKSQTVGRIVLPFEPEDDYDYSNKNYRAILSRGTVYDAVQGGSNF